MPIWGRGKFERGGSLTQVQLPTHLPGPCTTLTCALALPCPALPGNLPCPALLQASVAYYLMADNRRRMPSSAYLKEEMTEATDAHMQYPSGGRVGGQGPGVV